MTRLAALARLDSQRGALFAWIPVCLALGIGLYFMLPTEPGRGAWIALAASIGAGGWAVWFTGGRWPWITALVLVALGVGLAGIRTATVAAPVLGFRYYGPVEGRIVAIDRSGSDAVRLTLDRVILSRTAPARTPARVRLSLHGAQDWLEPAPGQTVMTTGHLSAPEGPVEPGGFDFRRMAWFQGIGAVGYTRAPVLLLVPSSRELPVARVRARIASGVRAHLPGDAGAFAAAITTGDRAGIAAETLADLRASNLAHLLAISGLHMGLLTAVVFGAMRLALAALPGPSLNWPTKSIAAVAALAAGAVYLALSGGNVATQRAFIMAAVVLFAVLLGRRAMTLRAVAVAATIVLVLRPEALAGPGFQMSFAATTALVWVFRQLRDQRLGRGATRWVATLVISSAVAGAATAPVGAAHFNQISQYGLIANLVSVPLMGLVIMPAAVLAAVLSPVGLGGIGLAIMEPAIRWILWVAQAVAGLDGSTVAVVAPGPLVLPAFGLGCLWVMLWRGRWRAAGAVPLAVSLGIWATTERPDILIDARGAIVGIMTAEGRALSKPRGGGFAAGVWLENDGDAADQAAAFARWMDPMPLDLPRGKADAWLAARADGSEIVEILRHIHGRNGLSRAIAACREGGIVVTTAKVTPGTATTCLMFDETRLRSTGAVAVVKDGARLRVSTVRETSGDRPWTRSGRGQ